MIDEKYKDFAEMMINLVEGIKRTGVRILELKDRKAKLLMPLKGNINHVGIMYAGSLFALGEFTGGVVPAVSFDMNQFFPIVKEITIKYLKPAKTDVTIEAELSEAHVKKILQEAEKNGKADIVFNLELKDFHEEVVSVMSGIWQIRKMPIY